MKKWSYLGLICSFMLLASIFTLCHATAETSTPMTALEKKLYEAAKKEGKLVYWDSLSLKEAAQFIKAFNNRFPGIDVSYWEGNANQVDEKYFAEHQAGRNPVDVMQIEWYDKYRDEGRLASLGDIVKDSGFPPEFCTKGFDAIAIEHTVKGAAYNTKLVSPKDVPRSWEDLLHPRWKGKIAVEVSLDTFVFLTRVWGDEKMAAYVKRLGEQSPIFVRGVTHAMTLLGAGEFPIAIDMNLHRTLDMQTKGTPVAWVPASPIVDKFAPYVTVRDAPHPNAARLYFRWLMSTEGQAMVDTIRKKGNPLPGAGTAQAKAIEQMGIKVVTIPQWEVDSKRLQDLYQKAIGFTRDSKVK